MRRHNIYFAPALAAALLLLTALPVRAAGEEPAPSAEPTIHLDGESGGKDDNDYGDQEGQQDSGSVYISAGDADGSGAVNGLDAAAILQYCVGLRASIRTEAADVDGDHLITPADAAALLKGLPR